MPIASNYTTAALHYMSLAGTSGSPSIGHLVVPFKHRGATGFVPDFLTEFKASTSTLSAVNTGNDNLALINGFIKADGLVVPPYKVDKGL